MKLEKKLETGYVLGLHSAHGFISHGPVACGAYGPKLLRWPSLARDMAGADPVTRRDVHALALVTPYPRARRRGYHWQAREQGGAAAVDIAPGGTR
jgi:hypothetical protein